MSAFERTESLIGKENVALLAQKRVAVFGVGGVGGFTCEGLARAGVGALDLFDNDTVAESNLNRQIIALRSSVGQLKTEVMARRIADITPECCVKTYPVFYTAENADEFPLRNYDCIVDAIDTVSSKITLIMRAQAASVPIISCMGTGNKLYPERLRVMRLEKTSVCPLARVMRRELKKRGAQKLWVVCSDEEPVAPAAAIAPANGRHPPASISFVPAAAGMLLAGAVVRLLLGMPVQSP